MPLLPDLQLASGTGGSDDKFLLSVFKAVFGSISTSPDLRAQTALKSPTLWKRNRHILGTMDCKVNGAF